MTSSTQSNNQVCTSAYKNLFALTPNIINQLSNFAAVCDQTLSATQTKENQTKSLASSFPNFFGFYLLTSNWGAYLKCNGVKVSIFCRKSSKVKVYRNGNIYVKYGFPQKIPQYRNKVFLLRCYPTLTETNNTETSISTAVWYFSS